MSALPSGVRLQLGRVRWPLAVLGSLAVSAVALSAVSLVLLRVTPFAVLREPSSQLVQLLDVRSEQNLPTWFVVAVLAVAAVAHASVGWLSGVAGRPSSPWFVTAALLALLSLDDAASLHERLEPVGRALGGGGGVTHFAWVVPGVLVAAVLAGVTARSVRRLPTPARASVAVGMGMVLAAAVLLEALGGLVLSTQGDGARYILVSHVEELVESLGAVVLLGAALVAVDVRATEGGVRVVLA